MTDWEARYWAKVDRRGPDECWPWRAALDSDGYGQMLWHGRTRLAHVIGWGLAGRVLPPGMERDHTCKHRWCQNPAHLEAVTHRVNVLRGTSPAAGYATATHCKRGHEFSEANTRIRPNGSRLCRACKRGRQNGKHEVPS